MAVKMNGVFFSKKDIAEIIQEINRRYKLHISTSNLYIWGEDGDSYPFEFCEDIEVKKDSESFKLLKKDNGIKEVEEVKIIDSEDGFYKKITTGKILYKLKIQEIAYNIIFEKYGVKVNRFVNPTKYCDWPGEILGFYDPNAIQ